MNVWAIVPVKPLNRAKSRLAAVLSPEARVRLAIRMLEHTLVALNESAAVSGVLVISRDNRALVVARKHRARTVQESGQPELNIALERASQVITSWNAQAALVLPADLPLIIPEDVRELVKLGRFHQSVVIVPDHNSQGTNGMLLRPPGLFPFMFGENSLALHTAAAEAAGADVHLYRSERMMLDVDTPEDLLNYLELCGKYGLDPLLDLTVDDLMPHIAAPQKEKP